VLRSAVSSQAARDLSTVSNAKDIHDCPWLQAGETYDGTERAPHGGPPPALIVDQALGWVIEPGPFYR
jgi:hypothetical protein